MQSNFLLAVEDKDTLVEEEMYDYWNENIFSPIRKDLIEHLLDIMVYNTEYLILHECGLLKY